MRTGRARVHAAYFWKNPRSDLSVTDSQKDPLRNEGIKGVRLLRLWHFATWRVTCLFLKSKMPQARLTFPSEGRFPFYFAAR